ncbi:hypothetical protein PROFUN_07416 [Planoprotostelium fungivorum]|nr:hypothetical protein PROFUN_07416 [Planoprotostelium fungivorum]
MAYYGERVDRSEGYWGPITANVDWCEPNYAHSYYLCEYWNTLSNIPMIVLGFWGMCYAFTIGAAAARNGFTPKNAFYSFTIGFFFLFLVGIGSWMFHMTLLYKYQMLDELPMILGSLVFVYIIMDLHPPKEISLGAEEKKPGGLIGIFDRFMIQNRTFRAVVLILYGVTTSVLMAVDTNNPLPMNLSYLGLVLFLVWRSCTGDSYAQKIVRHYFASALVYQIAAGLCWLVEKYLCQPLFPITAYLHAVWHVLAGTGVYQFIMW